MPSPQGTDPGTVPPAQNPASEVGMPLPREDHPSVAAPPAQDGDAVGPIQDASHPVSELASQDHNAAASAPPTGAPNPNVPAPPKQRRKRRKAHEIPPKGPPKKRGPKPKPLSERVYKPPKQIQRVERSYNLRKKEEVILYLLHHKIHDPNSAIKAPGGYRSPTFREASQFFGIPSSTIGGWFKNREKLEAKAANAGQ